eukprot:1000976-Pelagomonas_calceolata.AAC.3
MNYKSPDLHKRSLQSNVVQLHSFHGQGLCCAVLLALGVSFTSFCITWRSLDVDGRAAAVRIEAKSRKREASVLVSSCWGEEGEMRGDLWQLCAGAAE